MSYPVFTLAHVECLSRSMKRGGTQPKFWVLGVHSLDNMRWPKGYSVWVGGAYPQVVLGSQGALIPEVEGREAHGAAAGAKRHTGKLVGGTGKWQR